MSWVEISLGFAFGFLVFSLGIFVGRRTQRKAITRDFDAIIRRSRSFLAAGQLVKLDQFLHELTDDGPYVPSMRVLAENVLRRGNSDGNRSDNQDYS